LINILINYFQVKFCQHIIDISTNLSLLQKLDIANMTSLPKTYKAAVIEKANAPFTIKDVELKMPKAGEVLVKVIATGICHSDAGIQAGAFGNSFPIVPGHEFIGNVVAVGDGESRWKIGDRVGGAWHGGEGLASSYTPTANM
jgi:hypothetical protein